MRMPRPIMTTPVNRSCHLITPGCLPSQFPNVPDAIATDPRETIPASFWILPKTRNCRQTGSAAGSTNWGRKANSLQLSRKRQRIVFQQVFWSTHACSPYTSPPWENRWGKLQGVITFLPVGIDSILLLYRFISEQKYNFGTIGSIK